MCFSGGLLHRLAGHRNKRHFDGIAAQTYPSSLVCRWCGVPEVEAGALEETELLDCFVHVPLMKDADVGELVEVAKSKAGNPCSQTLSPVKQRALAAQGINCTPAVTVFRGVSIH